MLTDDRKAQTFEVLVLPFGEWASAFRAENVG
jgi:hypothetical protein